MGDWNDRKKLEEENRAQAERIAELEAAAQPNESTQPDPANDSEVTPENNPELYAEMVAHGKVPPPDEDD